MLERKVGKAVEGKQPSVEEGKVLAGCSGWLLSVSEWSAGPGSAGLLSASEAFSVCGKHINERAWDVAHRGKPFLQGR